MGFPAPQSNFFRPQAVREKRFGRVLAGVLNLSVLQGAKSSVSKFCTLARCLVETGRADSRGTAFREQHTDQPRGCMADTGSHPQSIFLTGAGMQRLRNRIAEARSAYMAVCADNENAAQAGDNCVWHDNFAYEENQRQMHRLAKRVRDLEELQARACVVPACSTAAEQVKLGTRVQLRFPTDQREVTLFIAGYDDGDPKEGRLSYTAPLAVQLIGARKGEFREIREAGRRREVEILAVLPASQEELP